MWEKLKGSKTYIVAGCGVIVAGLYSMGYIDQTLYDGLIGVLGALGLASVRHGMK